MAKKERSPRPADGRKMAIVETICCVLEHKGKEVWQISPTATVFEAIAEMADRGVGALLVVSEGDLVGIISERDYARKVILQGRSSQHTTVHEIMTPSPITVTPEYTVEECMKIMTLRRIRVAGLTSEEATQCWNRGLSREWSQSATWSGRSSQPRHTPSTSCIRTFPPLIRHDGVARLVGEVHRLSCLAGSTGKTRRKCG